MTKCWISPNINLIRWVQEVVNRKPFKIKLKISKWTLFKDTNKIKILRETGHSKLQENKTWLFLKLKRNPSKDFLKLINHGNHQLSIRQVGCLLNSEIVPNLKRVNQVWILQQSNLHFAINRKKQEQTLTILKNLMGLKNCTEELTKVSWSFQQVHKTV